MPTTLSYNANGDLIKIETSGVASGIPQGKKDTQTIVPRNADVAVDTTATINDVDRDDI